MKTPDPQTLARLAILAVAEIKSAVDAFDRGDQNVFEALRLVETAIEHYHEAGQRRHAA